LLHRFALHAIEASSIGNDVLRSCLAAVYILA